MIHQLSLKASTLNKVSVWLSFNFFSFSTFLASGFSLCSFASFSLSPKRLFLARFDSFFDRKKDFRLPFTFFLIPFDS
jgi:hypothetical protein